jgi:hypothetical protein
VPVGLEPPDTVARSDADLPIVMELGVTADAMVGVAFPFTVMSKVFETAT